MPKTRKASQDKLREAFVPVLKKAGARKAILFGSYSRGDADEFSDVDLIIIADSRRPFLERGKDYMDLWKVSPIKAMDVLIYTPEEFTKMQTEGNPFIAAALSEGITIYEA